MFITNVDKIELKLKSHTLEPPYLNRTQNYLKQNSVRITIELKLKHTSDLFKQSSELFKTELRII